MFGSVIDNNDHQRCSSQTTLHGQRSLGNSHGSGMFYPRSTQTIATQTQVREPIQPGAHCKVTGKTLPILLLTLLLLSAIIGVMAQMICQTNLGSVKMATPQPTICEKFLVEKKPPIKATIQLFRQKYYSLYFQGLYLCNKEKDGYKTDISICCQS